MSQPRCCRGSPPIDPLSAVRVRPELVQVVDEIGHPFPAARSRRMLASNCGRLPTALPGTRSFLQIDLHVNSTASLHGVSFFQGSSGEHHR
jgi:hypothetical protein